MSQVVKLSTQNGPVTALASLVLHREDGSEVRAGELAVGDTYVVTRGGVSATETVAEILPVSAEEEREFLQDDRIARLEQALEAVSSRLETTENALTSANDALLGLQRTIVELTAAHIDRIFSDQVMVDTMAQRFFIAGANAIAHKARQSMQRAPELVVIEQAIPGAIKATLLEEGGVLIEEQLAETGEWVTGEQLSEEMRADVIQEVFGNLLAGYGASIGRAYYIVEDVHLEQFRKDAQAGAKQALTSVAGAAAPVVEPEAPVESEAEAPVVH
ncbi:hypothetical protein D3C76_810750 [compost metagenome]